MGWGEKPAGVKILWIWAFGTAAILVTSVMRTRLQDMEKMMKAAEQQQQTTLAEGSVELECSSSPSDDRQ